MKYEEEYKKAKNIKEFLSLTIGKYPEIKTSSLRRRYYDLNAFFTGVVKKKFSTVKQYNAVEGNLKKEILKKQYGEVKEKPTRKENIAMLNLPMDKPDRLKMIALGDMKRMGSILSDDFLKRHGFTMLEINWLTMNGFL